MNKNKEKSAKKKKEKVIYYDDNSTISDMSGVSGTFNPIIPKNVGNKKNSQTYRDVQKRPSKFGDKWKTYWSTVRLMILPMCIVLGILFILFLLFMLIPTCAA